VQNGKLTEMRHYLDVFTALQQMGAIPTPG
jgi:hypothetical protein